MGNSKSKTKCLDPTLPPSYEEIHDNKLGFESKVRPISPIIILQRQYEFKAKELQELQKEEKSKAKELQRQNEFKAKQIAKFGKHYKLMQKEIIEFTNKALSGMVTDPFYAQEHCYDTGWINNHIPKKYRDYEDIGKLYVQKVIDFICEMYKDFEIIITDKQKDLVKFKIYLK